MGLFWAKYARRIFTIVSTTSIPNLAPVSPTEATVDPPSRGSRLDADHPENGVLIPRRFTGDAQKLVIGKPGDRVPELVSKSLGRGTPGSCGAVDQGRSRNKC